VLQYYVKLKQLNLTNIIISAFERKLQDPKEQKVSDALNY